MNQRIHLGSSQGFTSLVRFVGLLCIVTGVALTLVGCGGSSSSSSGSSSGFSSTASSAFASQIASGASHGMVASGAISKALLAHPDGVTCNQNSCVVNIPLSYTINCTTGGTMQMTGSITGSINNTGTGLLQFQSDITINSWSCIAGYTINGAPDITITGNFSFLNGAPSTTQEIVMGGGFNWGSSASDFCGINLTTNFNADGSGDTSGTLCGNQVNTSFSALQTDHHSNVEWQYRD